MSFDVTAFMNSSSDLLEEAMFGDVPQAVWGQKFKVEFLVTQDNMGFSPNLTVEIRLQMGGDPSYARTKRLIPLKSLIEMREADAISVLGNEVGQAVASLQTPRVLEHDPRIGMIYTIYGSSDQVKLGWPRMPLCDRATSPSKSVDGVFLNPFRFLGEVQRYLQNVESGGLYQGSFHTPIPCPFCGNTDLVRDQSHAPRDVVWAGGNVGWAHSRCASWLEPRVSLL